ncbi:MAG: response regulator transcription factor [Bacteroidia bacterium]|jgi:DNA-binding NarL/FixJ family response regulator|nr:response regulator transcription factor [Bacteroidia bacterium]
MRILLIDDHAIIIAGLQILLKDMYMNCKIDEAADGKSATALFEKTTYDLVIMDLNMPDTDTVKLIKHFVNIKPQTKILVFSMKKEDVYALGLIRLGVKGYISKESNYNEVRTAIERVVTKGIYVSDAMLTKMVSVSANSHNTDSKGFADNPIAKLTQREIEIVDLIAKGHGTKEIANLTGLKTNTISTFKTKIYSKLGVTNTLELSEFLKVNTHH